jgi:hypothetical protein
VQAADTVSITGNTIEFNAGTAQQSFANIVTTEGGDITLNATNSISFQGGNAVAGNCEASIYGKLGGNINLTGSNVFLYAGNSTRGPVNIMTGTSSGTGDISITGTSSLISNAPPLSSSSSVNLSTGIEGGSISFSGGIATTVQLQNTRLQTFSPIGTNSITISSGSGITCNEVTAIATLGNISLNSGTGSIGFTNSSFTATVPSMGSFEAIAGTNITFDTSSEITIQGASLPLALFVVDNNNPVSVGTGEFIYPIGANINVMGAGFVRIYSAAQSTNMVTTGALINGLNYTPATPGMSDAQEVWDVFYPTVPMFPQDGSVNFSIYYKSLNM